MVSVTSASPYITSASCYHPRYQSRSSMYICGLIPRNFAELAEAVPIVSTYYSIMPEMQFFNEILTTFICMLGNLPSLDLYN